LIATLLEVERVFGKIGRADAATATDPAPLTMIATLIQLKPESEWREGMTVDKLIDELDATVDLPGVTKAWVMPIKTRIDMLATGIKTPVGVKIAGPDLKAIKRAGGDPRHHLSVALPDLPQRRRSAIGDALAAVRIGRWLLADRPVSYNLSVAVAVGFIALAGVAAEFGVVMLVYPDNALKQWRAEGRLNRVDDLKDAIEVGAVLRIRPKAMTVATIFAGLLPIMLPLGEGAASAPR